MTLTENTNIEKQIDTLELFNESIKLYLNQFISARNILDEEKKSGNPVTLERLVEIFSEYNKTKQNIISSFFLLSQEDQSFLKDIELPRLFSELNGPTKSAIGEIKAGIENKLITNNI